MLGPALPHWRKPLLSYFIGDVTPRSFPEMYLAAVKNLLVRYTNLKVEGHFRIPLVINTMGWVKGKGLDLLNQIIAMSQPEHILQIVGNSEKKNVFH